MPVCRRCGKDKPDHKFQRRKRKNGSIWIGPTCFACGQRKWRDRPHPQLPVWPFRWWLKQRAAVYNDTSLYRRPRSDDGILGLDRLASHCAGTDLEAFSMERRFRDLLHKAKWVYFDTVDRSLQNEGSTQLWELVEMCEEHVMSNGYSFEQALRRLEDLRAWKKWA